MSMGTMNAEPGNTGSSNADPRFTTPRGRAQERLIEVPVGTLETAVGKALRNAGTPEATARRAARDLVTNELEGQRAYGLQCLPELVDAIRSGDLVPDAAPRVEKTSPRSWRICGGRAFGSETAGAVAKTLIAGARAQGMASVTLTGRNPLGRLSAIAAPVAEAGLVVLGFSRSRYSAGKVVPHGGREGRLGSNPLVFAAPANGNGPVVVDMSTSSADEGEVRSRVAHQKPLPDGWLVDHDGTTVRRGEALDTDPPQAFLLPLGGRGLGQKGFGLGMMVEILAGVLTGHAAGSEGDASDDDAHGAFFVALSPSVAGRDEESVRHDVEALCAHLQDAGEGSRVEIPGWGERERRSKMLLHGSLALPSSLWLSVLRLAERPAQALAEPLPATLTTARVVAAARKGPRRLPQTAPRIEPPAAPQRPTIPASGRKRQGRGDRTTARVVPGRRGRRGGAAEGIAAAMSLTRPLSPQP